MITIPIWVYYAGLFLSGIAVGFLTTSILEWMRGR